MKLFILYQTDRHKSVSSKVLFGVFSSEELATEAANLNGLVEYDSDILIEPATLNQFGEI